MGLRKSGRNGWRFFDGYSTTAMKVQMVEITLLSSVGLMFLFTAVQYQRSTHTLRADLLKTPDLLANSGPYRDRKYANLRS